MENNSFIIGLNYRSRDPYRIFSYFMYGNKHKEGENFKYDNVEPEIKIVIDNIVNKLIQRKIEVTDSKRGSIYKEFPNIRFRNNKVEIYKFMVLTNKHDKEKSENILYVDMSMEYNKKEDTIYLEVIGSDLCEEKGFYVTRGGGKYLFMNMKFNEMYEY